jgi:dienelactone hydrolase
MVAYTTQAVSHRMYLLRQAAGLLGVLFTGALCAQELERVSWPVGQASISGLLIRPFSLEAGTKSPAVVALHGCGGLGAPLFPRHADYARKLSDAGFVVLFPDSFSPRGVKSICKDRQRTIRPGLERVQDTLGALNYLVQQPLVDPKRIYLLGWSNGGSTVLHALSAMSETVAIAGQVSAQFAAAVAFYPGCTSLLERQRWRTSTPLLLLLGGKDNWTPASPCEAFAKRAQAQSFPVEAKVYPEAVHDFDAPNARLRERTGLAFTADGSGRAWVGTHEESRLDAQRKVVEFFRAGLR